MKLFKVLDTHAEFDAWGRANPGVELVDNEGYRFRFQRGMWQMDRATLRFQDGMDRGGEWTAAEVDSPYVVSFPAEAPIRPPAWVTIGRKAIVREIDDRLMFDGEVLARKATNVNPAFVEKSLDALTEAMKFLCSRAPKKPTLDERIRAAVRPAVGMVGTAGGRLAVCTSTDGPIWRYARTGARIPSDIVVTPDIGDAATKGQMVAEIRYVLHPGVRTMYFDGEWSVYNQDFLATESNEGLALLAALEKIQEEAS